MLTARAYDRANRLDSAAAAYRLAAGQLPRIADWLLLRADGVTADSAARARDYAAIRLRAARLRIPWTEAQARERTGDAAGAARAYDALGAHVDALRNIAALVAVSGDPGARDTLHARLFAVIRGPARAADVRAAIEIADRAFGPLPSEDERAVAHAAFEAGDAARALTAFERIRAAPGQTPLSAAETFAYATALARARHDSEAAAEFASVSALRAPPALERAARYERGRSLVLAGEKDRGRAALRDLVRRAPSDTAAGDALMLLADLASDDRDDAAARRAYRTVARRFAKHALAPRAAFRAALIAYIGGQPRTAAREWDALVAAHPQADDLTAARYWSGRAWAAGGRPATAAARWRSVMATDPLSYYAAVSAHRLNAPGPLDLVARDTVVGALGPAGDSTLARVAVLHAVGMTTESRFEVDELARDAGDQRDAMLAIGTALVRADEAPHAIALGWRLLARGDSAWRDGRVLRLVYPLLYGDTVLAQARAHDVDPALVAAVVRQESGFNPVAISPAGARGLMQLMPAVARGLARSRGLATSDPSLLDDPFINLTLGIAHLAAFRELEHGDLVRTLAAYNAGPSRVVTWSARRGTDDAEVFIERIPFAETRDYVRAILRGRDIYTALYGL